jgi:hypothetical protein
MDADDYTLQARIAETGPIYAVACRRAEKAARRGDVKTSGHWLAIAERHLAMTDRINRMSISRVKQQAIIAEHPYRLTILEYRARFSG